MRDPSSLAQLQNRLNALLEKPILGAWAPGEADVIVSPNEVNRRHGTGVLLLRMFGGKPNILSVRSQNTYEGDHQLRPGLVLKHATDNRPEAFARVGRLLGGVAVRRVVCVPYFRDDLLTAIAIRDIFGVPLCMYIMDDNNVVSGASPSGIPDCLMEEALAKSRLRLAISSEMRDAYEVKFGHKFWFLPPVVSPELIRRTPAPFSPAGPGARGVLVGNIWDSKWLELLCRTVRGSGWQIDWYCNRGNVWMHLDEEELKRNGISLRPAATEEDLAQVLPRYAFALMPSGRLTEEGNAKAVAQLSLPSRICYVSACSHTPILVLGHRDTAAARFVLRAGIGLCADYDPAEFSQAVQCLCMPEAGRRMRANAARIAGHFSAERVAEWIWTSLQHGEPADDRFERLGADTTGGGALNQAA